jgi:hypothetical protein
MSHVTLGATTPVARVRESALNMDMPCIEWGSAFHFRSQVGLNCLQKLGKNFRAGGNNLATFHELVVAFEVTDQPACFGNH